MSLQIVVLTPPREGVCANCGHDTIVSTLLSGVVSSNALCAHCITNGAPFVFPAVIRTPVTAQMRRSSVRQEKKIAHDIGGRRQRGSGSIAHNKGDVRKSGVFRIEAKQTRSRSYNIHLADLYKIRSECAGGETPAFQITFMDRDLGHPIDEWVMVPYTVWSKLNGATENRRSRNSR